MLILKNRTKGIPLDRFHQSILVCHTHATFYVQVSAAFRSIQHHLSSRILQWSKKRTWIMDNTCTELFLVRLHGYSLSLLSAQQVVSVTPAPLQVLVLGSTSACSALGCWHGHTPHPHSRTISHHDPSQAQSPSQDHSCSAHHRFKHICSH